MSTLAIFTSQLGTASETFVRRHVENLLPGQTVVVARNSASAFGGFWEVDCPVFYIDRWARRLSVRAAQRIGIAHSRLRDTVVAGFLKSHGVTVVLGEYLDQFLDFVPLLTRIRLPYVVQAHGIDVSAALRKPDMARRYLEYNSATAILTRCEFHRKRLVNLGLPVDKIHVNPGGVDVPQSVPERGREAFERFLAIGRMVPKKGPIYLLESFRIAAEADTNISLDYIGDGPLFPAAMQFVNASGLRARVRLHGAAPEHTKSRLFRECGVFVQHSVTDPETGDEEGLPASIQEAMVYGMAIISTRHSGIPEALEDGVTGLLVEEGDSLGMAKAMLRLSSEHGYCLELGKAARSKAKQLYTWTGEQTRLLDHLSKPSVITSRDLRQIATT